MIDLWQRDGGHWFFDTVLGVVVGQAERSSATNRWSVEVNDEWVGGFPSLEHAQLDFVARYDQARARAQCGPGSGDGDGAREGYTITRLPARAPRGGAKVINLAHWIARAGI